MATLPIVYNQLTQDVANDKVQDARFIGHLDTGRTMLNVSSALTKRDDQADIYRLRLTKDTNIFGVGSFVIGPGEVRVELLNRGGRVLADSAATSGVLKERYDKMNATNLDLTKGDYYVRVTRAPGQARNSVVQYSLQLRSGFEYREDYSTTEKPPSTTSVQASGASIASAAMSAQLEKNVTSLLNKDNFFVNLLA